MSGWRDRAGGIEAAAPFLNDIGRDGRLPQRESCATRLQRALYAADGMSMDSDDEPDPPTCWVCDAMLEPSGRCRACEYLENAGERLDPGGYARDAEAELHDPFLQALRAGREERP